MKIAGLLVAVVALLACGWDDERAPDTARPRGVGNVGADLRQQGKPRQERQEPEQDPFFAPEEPEEVEEKPEQEEEEPERDYSAELRTAFGSPIGCLKPRQPGDDAPSKITISLDATVMAGGNISRGYASSAELDAEETRCLQTQLESRRIAGDVLDAPRSVQTSITLELTKPKQSGE